MDEKEIPLKETSSYGIVMGNGVAIRGKGVCKQLTLELPDLIIIEDFLPLELGSVDLILGMQWLRGMGYMGVDWTGLTMSFKRDGKKITIKGDSSLTRAEVSLKSLNKKWSESDQGFLVELRALTLEEQLSESDSNGEEETEEARDCFNS